MSKHIKPVQVGEFCTVLDSSFAMFGVKKGDVVYVAGDTVVPVGPEDPYELRRIFLCAYVVDKVVDAERKPFMMDGKRLKPVSKKKQEEYYALFAEKYGDKEDEAKD